MNNDPLINFGFNFESFNKFESTKISQRTVQKILGTMSVYFEIGDIFNLEGLLMIMAFIILDLQCLYLH